MQEQLDEVLLSEVPVVVSAETQELESEQEQKMVLQLAVMIRTIGDAFKENRELDESVDIGAIALCFTVPVKFLKLLLCEFTLMNLMHRLPSKSGTFSEHYRRFALS